MFTVSLSMGSFGRLPFNVCYHAGLFMFSVIPFYRSTCKSTGWAIILGYFTVILYSTGSRPLSMIVMYACYLGKGGVLVATSTGPLTYLPTNGHYVGVWFMHLSAGIAVASFPI